LIVFARSDDYFFGVLHSSVHELWALRMGTQLEDRPRYTPTTCFETFPLPWPPGREPFERPRREPVERPRREPVERAGEEPPAEQQAEAPGRVAGGTPATQLHARIAAAAAALNEQRERWLNPPELIAPIARNVDSLYDFSDVPADARPLIRQSAIQALAAKDKDLKRRTLTNLYNERPTWLRLAHLELDRAVVAAYAAVDPEGGWREDWAEVWEPTGAGQRLPEGNELAERRREAEEAVLANLLRLNLSRAG
jgi:hypothetical protein